MRDVSQDYAAAVEMVRRSGQQGVPVITLDDEVVVGFDRPRLEQILAASGTASGTGTDTGTGATGGAGATGAGTGSSAAASGTRPAPRVKFGAAIADASRITMQQGKLPLFGAYVGKVAPGSPAQRAGLQPGDIVTELNLRAVTNADTMEQALATLEPGSLVRVLFTRGDRNLRAEVRV